MQWVIENFKPVRSKYNRKEISLNSFERIYV